MKELLKLFASIAILSSNGVADYRYDINPQINPQFNPPIMEPTLRPDLNLEEFPTYNPDMCLVFDDHAGNIRCATSMESLKKCDSVSIEGSIEFDKDSDYFRIIGNGFTTTIYTIGSTDTYGYLLDSNGDIIASNDDGYYTYNFYINKTLEKGKVYYIKVRHYFAKGRGDYKLIVRNICVR